MTIAEAKQEPAHAVTDQTTGSRWYIHPTTGERFISVTTALSYIAKFGLNDWAARLSAEAAFERLPWLNRCARVAACNASKTDAACGQCRECSQLWLANRHNETRDQAGNRGSRVHEAAEQLELFGEGATVDDDIADLVDGYRRWRQLYRPEFLATEMTVVSRKWGYAGTLDGIIRYPEDAPLPAKLGHLAGKALVSDTKTGKHLGVSEGWQVCAYAHADVVLLPDGTEEPMPAVEGGQVLHVRPGKVQMREAHLADTNHAYFVHLLRVVEGLTGGLGAALSRPVNVPMEVAS